MTLQAALQASPIGEAVLDGPEREWEFIVTLDILDKSRFSLSAQACSPEQRIYASSNLTWELLTMELSKRGASVDDDWQAMTQEEVYS